MSRDALIVGINNYQELSNLSAPAEDAEAIARLLKDYGDFDIINRLPEAINEEKNEPYVARGKKVSLAELEDALIQLFNPKGRNIPDTALFYFSGHGFRRTEGLEEGFLATTDVEPDKRFYGLSLQWLCRLLQESPIKQQIIWLDCCHSGELLNFNEANPGKLGKARDRCFIAASKEFQKAYEELGSPYSVLTKVLLEGLDPKRCPQQWVTNISLTDYIDKHKHLQGAIQTPLFTNFGESINLTRTWEVSPQITESEVTSDICPYKGLEYFDCNDKDPKYFYGREQLTEQLIDKVRQSNFLAIVGASGSGKSSVMRAGLLHQLKLGRKLSGSGDWEIQILVPGEHPLENLALSFIDPNLSGPERGKQLGTARELLKKGAEGLELLVKSYDAPKFVIVVDQFEEIFTLCEDVTERKQFFECLLGAVEKAEGKLCFILAMRANFMANALSYLPFAYMLQNADIKLSPMSRAEVKEVIEKPAEKLGVTFEAGLVERILNDVENEPGNLPLLEFALRELWKKRIGKKLTHNAYDAIGQVKGALADYADDKYNNLTAKEKEQARQIFIQLVCPLRLGEGTENTRRRANRGELGKENWNLITRQDGLADSRLVVTSSNDTEQETVEIVHEALIQNWDQMQRWIATDRVFRAWQERLRGAMAQWKQTNKDKGSLLRGAALAEAEDWRQNRSSELSPRERDFIRLSREVEKGQQRRAIFLLFFVTFLLLPAPLAIFSWKKWGEAARQSVNANYNFSKFLSLDEQSLEALVAAVKAGQQVKVANLRNTDAEIWAVSALRQELYSKKRFRELNRLEGHNQPVISASFSPEGQVLVTRSKDEVKVWQRDGTLLQTLQLIVSTSEEAVKIWQRDGTLLQTLDKNSQVSFSPDSQLIVSSSEETVKLWQRDGTLLLTFDKNSQVSFSPDSQLIVSNSEETVKLWQRDGTLLQTFDKNSQVSFSPDSQLIVSASWEVVKLWRHDGTLLQTLDKNSRVIFSPDGQTIASINEKAIKLWRRDGTLLQSLEQEDGRVIFSPDGQLIVSTSREVVKLWRRDGTLLQTLDKNSRVIFSPDGQTIAAIGQSNNQLWSYNGTSLKILEEGSSRAILGSNGQVIGFFSEGILRLWSIDGTLLANLEDHVRNVNSINLSPDGQLIASTSEGAVKLWRRDGTLLQTFDKNSRVSFSPNSQLIASISENILEIWNRDGFLLDTLKSHHSEITSVNFSPDGKMIASTARTTVRLWHFDGKLLKMLEGHGSNANSVNFSPDGQIIASTSNDKTIKLWHRDGTLLKTLDGHKNWVLSVSFSPDSKILASASTDRTVKLWRRDGKLFKTLEGHKNGVLSVSFSPDGKILASASADRTVKLWHRDGTLLKTLEGHGSEVSSVEFSPDSKIIATASWDGTVKLWHRNGALLNTLEGHNDLVLSVSFSPDGQTIATASWDGTVKLWHRNGALLNTLEGHSDSVLSVSFSPNGQTIASASADNNVRLWHRNGTLINTLKQHRDWVRSVSFSPDGKTIASASEDGTIILWKNLNLDELLIRTCNWLDDYLRTNLNVSKEDRKICDGVAFKGE